MSIRHGYLIAFLRSISLPKQLQTLVPLPLYAGLTNAEQLQVFETTARGYRKVVIATNEAEVRGLAVMRGSAAHLT